MEAITEGNKMKQIEVVAASPPALNSVVNGDSPSGLRQNRRFFPSSGTERH